MESKRMRGIELLLQFIRPVKSEIGNFLLFKKSLYRAIIDGSLNDKNLNSVIETEI